MNVDNLEMMEFGFASTATNFATAQRNSQEIRNHIRESLRLHRFLVFSWLLENGAQLPANLIADSIHPEVGQQMPDRPASSNLYNDDTVPHASPNAGLKFPEDNAKYVCPQCGPDPNGPVQHQIDYHTLPEYPADGSLEPGVNCPPDTR